MTNKTAQETLIEIYDRIQLKQGGDHVVEYNDAWNNGTGYFDNLVTTNLELCEGSRFAAITPEPNNRKIVGVVTAVGNLVFFERYTAGDRGIVSINYPRALSGLYESGMQNAETIINAVGGAEGHSQNIGEVLENVLIEVKKIKARKLLGV